METASIIYNPDFMKAQRLKDAIKDTGRTQRELADALDISETMLSKSISGNRKFKISEVMRMSEFLGWDTDFTLELIENDTDPARRPTLPLVGYVGAGEIVYPIDDHETGGGLDISAFPPGEGRSDLVAVEVRGDSMHPVVQNGWWLYFRRDHDGVSDDCIRRLCIVKVANDGPTLVKTVLKEGANPGRYILNSYNADPMINVALDWAAPVEWVRPKG